MVCCHHTVPFLWIHKVTVSCALYHSPTPIRCFFHHSYRSVRTQQSCDNTMRNRLNRPPNPLGFSSFILARQPLLQLFPHGKSNVKRQWNRRPLEFVWVPYSVFIGSYIGSYKTHCRFVQFQLSSGSFVTAIHALTSPWFQFQRIQPSLCSLPSTHSSKVSQRKQDESLSSCVNVFVLIVFVTLTLALYLDLFL